MIVVSDTSPICYLLLIDEIDILYRLYQKVLISTIIQQELSHSKSPIIVQNWINNPPDWLIIHYVTDLGYSNLDVLDKGEKSALILAEQQNADLMIIDDGLGRKFARSRGFKVTGLLGVLDAAAQQNLLDFPTAISQLKKTTFRASPALISSLLNRYQP